NGDGDSERKRCGRTTSVRGSPSKPHSPKARRAPAGPQTGAAPANSDAAGKARQRELGWHFRLRRPPVVIENRPMLFASRRTIAGWVAILASASLPAP